MEIKLKHNDVFVSPNEIEEEKGQKVVNIKINVFNKTVVMKKSGRTFKYE